MLRALFAAAGIDFRQWLALTKTSIKRDIRESSMSATLHHGRSGSRSFLSMLFFYLLSGLIFIPIVLATDNLFMSATLLITYTMFMVGSLILVEYHAVVISPGDFSVLGYQPVSSRTFYVAKLTNLLFYVVMFTSVLALPAIIAFFLRDGFSPLVGLTALWSVSTANVTVALWVVLLYTFVLSKVNASRLQNLLTFFQVLLALVIYSGFFVFPRLIDEQAFLHMDLTNTPWLVFLPSTWFSSFLSIAVDQASVLHWLLAALSLLAFAVAAVASIGKLSLSYSFNLSRVSAMPAGKGRRTRRSVFVFPLGPEERVVSKLIRNQFLNDNKFKMAVLGILPLTAFYLFLGTQNGRLPDPFVDAEIELSRSGLLYLIIFLFPMMLRTYVTQSDSYQASWLFHVAPVDLPKLIRAEKNFLMVYFVLPFLAILCLVFYYNFTNVLHVLLHALALGVLSHMFLQFAFLYSPDLPFSRPNVKGQRSRNLAMLMILVPFLLYLGLPLVFRYIYADPTSYVVFILTLMTVTAVLEKLMAVRVLHYGRKLEFLD